MKKIVVLGSLNMDFVIRTKEMPQIGETVLGESVCLVPGGKGANQAYAAGKLGGEVIMLGAVGADKYGEQLCQNLRSVRVNTDGIWKLEEIPTGQAFVSVYDSGDNSIVVIPGANGALSRAMIEQLMTYIEECDYLLMQMEIPLDIVKYVKELAIRMGKKVVLDPAPAVPGLEEAFWRGISILKPNETELEILTGKKPDTWEDLKEMAGSMVRKGVETVIVTLGGKGCLLVNQEKEIYFPAYKADIVDTTAAGDSFIAALLVALCEGKTYEEAVAFAQKVSSVVVGRRGAQTSIPWRHEMERETTEPDGRR